MSLTRTCMDCHSNKAEFCDRCHNYLAVRPVLLELPRGAEGGSVMDASRRGFLKLAGVTVVSAAGGGALVVRPSSAEGPAYGEAEVPQAGTKRLAMVVDLRKFTKNDELVTRCIKACRQAHNVPDFGDDRKNAVKWIWAESFETAFVSQEFHYLRADLEGKQTLLLCNHCTNPPCVRVCPTQATFKRSSDGIVMMDWHRCIGCRYCVVACPYGSRSFNWTDPRPHIADVNPDFPTRMRGCGGEVHLLR